MTIVTRISFGSEHMPSYINEAAYTCLSRFMSLHPAETTLLDDEVDFILSREGVYPNNLLKPWDTIILTADSKGVGSNMRCHCKIGKRTYIPLSSGLHRTALSQSHVTRFNTYPIDVGIFDDSKPVDVILRTNRKLVTCESYGTQLRITMEKHWRGPWSNPDHTKIYFIKDPVYFIEAELDGDASIETCRLILQTLLPNWISLKE